MILILGLTDTRAKELAKEETRHGLTPFHLLETWNTNMRTGHRLVWDLCWGISLVACDMAQIRKIVAAIGDLVEVDDNVEEL